MIARRRSRWARRARTTTLAVCAAAVLVSCSLGGCSSMSYYAQSLNGHWTIVRRAEPVTQWLADETVDPALKERLALTQRMRDFAVQELHEPDNASYRRYADLGRGAAVWNVVAAPELSLQLKTWCFVVVGCVGYRGYYDRSEADRYAKGLRDEGLEVSVYGVPAYSTLGLLPGAWFADPLLNTFIHYPEGELARLIFHELAHQIAYASGDTVFNESFATAVERIGVQRWLSQHASVAAQTENQQIESRRQDFHELTERYRARLQALYDSPMDVQDKRARKSELWGELRRDYEHLKTERWGGYAGYDGWIRSSNNASFGVLAAYNTLVPNFERLYAREGQDFALFYAEVQRLTTLSLADRRQALP